MKVRSGYEMMTQEEGERRAQAAAESFERDVHGIKYWGDKPSRKLRVGLGY
jgi:hypothetical protein